MFRDYILQTIQLLFFGPIVLFRVLFTVAAVAAVLSFLLPGLLVALWAILGLVPSVVWDFLVHPSLFKLWILLCLIAAIIIVLPKFKFPSVDLPTPKVRRGRHIEQEKTARDRAIENIERRRNALRHLRHRTRER